jgi:tRNA-Thr(GGU) m(6)t(6)A37 methyltransferase TsaA
MTTRSSCWVGLSLVTATAIGFAFYYYKKIESLEKELQTRREREAFLERESSEQAKKSFTMKELGRLQSPFPQRAGCPRQGGVLAPHIRSRLIFHQNIPQEMLDGITSYSHVWIVFAFHLNPRGKASSGRQGKVHFTATKIRPPRANGVKVGVLATRAPHRPNPIGLSLGLIEKVEIISVEGSKRVCLVLRGLDLVNDTPVYDIKPYVPWDRVESLESIPSNASLPFRIEHLVAPKWVLEDDELPRVEWTMAATDALLNHGEALRPLYDDVAEAKLAVSEIVAQDPRALHDGRGTTSGNDFHFSFGSLRVSFRVQEGAATVTQVMLDEGDLHATPGSYPHNLALRRQAEKRARDKGLKIEWQSLVREGVTEDLFALKAGGWYDIEHMDSTTTISY